MTREESIIFVGTLKTVIKDIPKYNGAGIEEAMDMAIKALEEGPKAGHWIHHEERLYICAEHWECSQCHRSTMTNPFPVNDNDYNAMYYCPKCGAKMIESQESEDKDADSN